MSSSASGGAAAAAAAHEAQEAVRRERAKAFFDELVLQIPHMMRGWCEELFAVRKSELGAVHEVTVEELEETMWGVWVQQPPCLRVVNDVMFVFGEGAFRFNVCSGALSRSVLVGISENGFWTVHGPDASAAGERESYKLTNFRYDKLAPRMELAFAAMRSFYAIAMRFGALTDEHADFLLESFIAKLQARAGDRENEKRLAMKLADVLVAERFTPSKRQDGERLRASLPRTSVA